MQRLSKAAEPTGLQVGTLSGVKTGSSKISHLRTATAAADEMLFWQMVLLRHFVPFTHQLAVPGDDGQSGRQPAAPNHNAAHKDSGTRRQKQQQQAAAAAPDCTKNTTYRRWALKVWHTRGTSTISHPPCARTHTHRRGNAHPR